LFSCKLAWPLSSLSESDEESQDEDEEEDELEELDEDPLELSENIPLCFLRSTPSAALANSGNFVC